ncbi:unnamed protein product [Rotaria socialis]|uniref:Extended synaptotagmin-2 n=1 Tax=Rotaria socialis TaxID=392032 RepID=A0A821ATA1_9BILA|nr:unnamed protein product [Rotaria socialis]
MADIETQSLYVRASTMISRGMATLTTFAQNYFAEQPLNAEPESTPLSSSRVTNEFRKLRLPKTRIGLGSTEADLIVLTKNYLEIVGLVFFVWVLGYFHFSMSWILLAVFIYLFRQRQRAQSKQRHNMLNEINQNEEQYIKARLDELPSWVFFPDVERAEWLNRIIKQMWPYANQYLDKDIFRDLLIPIIRGTSPALADFSFEKLDLGEVPPRIGGVKVYADNVRDQIMMDIEVFYAGDACVKAKLKGIVCGVKDIQFVGEIRIILSPLINTIPLVGAVTYFFLRKPSIDFKLTDAGTLVDIPGLNDLMLVQINEIVASMMVLPNRQVFALARDIQIGHLRWSNPQGVVRVFVLRAQNLIKADISLLGKGKSDPFVTVKLQGTKEYKTKTIDNTTDPTWNEVFEFVVEQSESDVVQFEVYDEDPGKDDFIGRAQYPLKDLVDGGHVDTWLTLQDVKKGTLNVGLQYFTLTKQKSCIDVMHQANLQILKREPLSKALLVCFIDQCTNLPRSKKTRREPNPFCRIKVEATEDKTRTFDSQTNPKFEHVSQILCANPLHEKLKIDVCDAKTNNEIIGYFEIPIKQIFDTETMTIETQAYSLKCLSEPFDRAQIFVRLSLLILSPERSSETRESSPSKSSSANGTKSFDIPLGSNVTTGKEQNYKKESSVQESSEEDNSQKTLAAALQSASNIHRSLLETHVTPGKKTAVISEDPDLRGAKYGRIKVGIRYTAQRKALSIHVYACTDLINVHSQNLPDPYIRLTLLPDFKKDKKKTKPIHDSLNPRYDDLFEWQGSLADMRRQRLYFSIKNHSPLFTQEETYMGDLQIDLSNLDPEKISIAWYALQEPNTSGGGIMKIKYDTLDSNE